MQKQRLFIGTSIDKSLFEFIYDDIKDDFYNACAGKWVEPENLHFTFKFLGDVNADLTPKIKHALDAYLSTFDSELLFKGLGAFPNTKRPRVLFASFSNPGALVFQLHKNIDRRLQEFGFGKEKKPFNPHLTLRRIKSFNQPEFSGMIEKYREIDFGIMNSFSVDLIESKLTRTGPIYTII